MGKLASVALVLLGCAATAARAEDEDGWALRPRPVALGLSLGTYLLFVNELSAEVLLIDRVAIGAKAVRFPGSPAETAIVPSIAVGSRRSLPSAAYVALAWAPGSTTRSFAGTLGVGGERAVGQVRLFGEAGLLAGAGEENAIFLPYLLAGLRLRL